MRQGWIKNTFPLFWDSIKFVLAPPICALCEKIIDTEAWQSTHICQACFDALPKTFASDNIIRTINQNFGEENNPFDFAISLFDSSGNQKFLELIHLFKYNKFISLGVFLGQKLAERIYEEINIHRFRFDAVIPVPIHKAKLRERGFNQSEIIGKEISKRINSPVQDLIFRIRYTETQTKLNLEQRKINVQNAFNLNTQKDEISNKSFLLVDDVFTTGSTLVNCGKLLKENGAKFMAFAVIATA